MGRFGDTVRFVDLPNEVRTEDVMDHFGEASEQTGSAVVTCGSRGEVANEPALGKYFNVANEKQTEWGLEHQKGYIFFDVALNATDQLRQRVAFGLSQILVVVPAGTSAEDHTEPFVTYHDIMVHNAFGNYRDILKQTAYNPFMADHLTYMQSKSAAYMWEHQNKHAFADENYAREVMQVSLHNPMQYSSVYSVSPKHYFCAIFLFQIRSCFLQGCIASIRMVPARKMNMANRVMHTGTMKS